MRLSRSDSASVSSSSPSARRQRRYCSVPLGPLIGQSQYELQQRQRLGEGGVGPCIARGVGRGGDRTVFTAFHRFEQPAALHGIEGANRAADNRQELDE